MIPDTFFGTTTHVNNPYELQLLKNLQVPCVRLDFHHVGLEPAQGQYRFEAGNPPHSWMIDSADLGAKEGMDQIAVITTIFGAPWMCNPDGTFPREEYLKSFEDFMFALATKYKGKIRYWQAGNEPNLTAEWKDRYVPMLKAFYKGVKRADPNNKVLLAGFDGDEISRLEVAYQKGAKDFFDIIASHSYTRPRSPEEGGYLDKIAALHRVMRKYGDNKPLWVTEIGWNGVEPSMLEYLKNKFEGHRNYSCTLEEQARYLPRAYLLSAMYPWIERVYFFQLHNNAEHTQVSEKNDNYIGVVEPWEDRWAPRESYYSLKTVIQMLRGSTFVRQIPMGRHIWALAFERKDDAVIALWSLDDGATLKLRNTSMIQGITSMVGTPILLKDDTLHLSGRVIYVHVAKDKLAALTAQIRNGTITGSPTFILSIGMNTQLSKPDRPVIDATVTNVSKDTLPAPKLDVSIAPPYSVHLQANDMEEFAAGREKTFSLPVNVGANTGGLKTLTVSATLEKDKTKVSAKTNIEYFVIPSWRGPAAEQASWDDWPAQGELRLESKPKSISGEDWKSASDCSATARLAWNAEALHVAVKVKDDVLFQDSAPPSLWAGDSIQIGLDAAGDARPSSNVQRYDGVNDVELGVAWGKEQPAAYAWALPENQSGPLTPTRLTVTREESTKITMYLMVLPWAAIGVTPPHEGQWMGMNVVINDNDGKDNRGWVEWTGGIGGVKDPSQFAKVVLGN